MFLGVTVIAGQAAAQAPTRDSARVLAPIAVIVKTDRVLDAVGFTSRKDHGVGRYITREEIARKSSFRFTDLLRSIPGLRVGINKYGDDVVSSPRSGGSVLSASSACVQYFVDGVRFDGSPAIAQGMNRSPELDRMMAEMAQRAAQELNAVLRRDDVLGIEVYQGAETPPKFNQGGGNCATILIWTKESAERDK